MTRVGIVENATCHALSIIFEFAFVGTIYNREVIFVEIGKVIALTIVKAGFDLAMVGCNLAFECSGKLLSTRCNLTF